MVTVLSATRSWNSTRINDIKHVFVYRRAPNALLSQSPVCAIVGNDACWTQIAREQVPMFKTSVACDLEVETTSAHLLNIVV